MAKKGSSERVTDTPSENSFITSAYGGINITKKDADMIETGLKLEPYSEHSTKGAGKNRDKEPMVMTLADMIFNEKDKGSKKITPAEASDIIKRKLPTRQGYKIGGEYSSDLFMDRTNAMNKGNRLPYLEGIKQISEWEKTKKELNKSKRRLNSALTNFAEDIGVKEILTDDSLQLFQKGGRVGVLDRYKELKSAYTPKAQSGEDLSTLISSAGPLLMQLFGGGKDEQLANGLTQNQMNQLNILRGASGIQGLNASNRLRSAFGDARDLTNQGFDAQRDGRVQGSLLKGLSILGQDPSVDIAGRQNVATLNPAALRRRSLGDQQALRGEALSALARNPNFDPRQGVGREIGALVNASNRQISQDNARIDQIDVNQRQANFNADFDFDNRLAGKRNQERTNTNFLNDRLGSEAQGLSNFLGDNQFNRNNTLSNLGINRANSLTNQERAFLQDQLNFIVPGSVQNGVENQNTNTNVAAGVPAAGTTTTTNCSACISFDAGLDPSSTPGVSGWDAACKCWK